MSQPFWRQRGVEEGLFLGKNVVASPAEIVVLIEFPLKHEPTRACKQNHTRISSQLIEGAFSQFFQLSPSMLMLEVSGLDVLDGRLEVTPGQ